MELTDDTHGYIVVYGKSDMETSLVADALQDKLRDFGINSLVHRVQGTRYTLDALRNELKQLGVWQIIIFNADSHDMIPKLDQQLFKVRVE